MSACLSGSFFVVTLISCNEHGNLRKVNVSVKEVNGLGYIHDGGEG